MIPENQLEEIRALLNKAENPVFFFDDDPDGLCSFLLLWKYIKKGRGLAIKGAVHDDYVSKIKRLNPDLVVFLDKPVIEEEVVNSIKLPIIHIDHHEPLTITAPNYHYYNPRVENDKDNRPTSYWCYQVTKQNMWLAVIGIVSDWFIPEFLDEFNEKYPGFFSGKVNNPGQALFEEEFGKLAKAFAFSLKGKSDVRNKCLKILTRIEGPFEILNEKTPQGKFVHKHFLKMNKAYDKLLKEALETKPEGKLLIFTYPSIEHSFTSLLSNELIYRNQDKVVIIGRVKDDSVIMSFRSAKIKLPNLITEALEGLSGGGGGHDLACGGWVNSDDYSTFINRFEKLVAKA